MKKRDEIESISNALKFLHDNLEEMSQIDQDYVEDAITIFDWLNDEDDWFEDYIYTLTTAVGEKV